jgi:probable rRNA maturation factor
MRTKTKRMARPLPPSPRDLSSRVSVPEVEIHVDDETFPEAPVALIEPAVRRTLESEQRTDVEVSIALLADAEIQRLNMEYLGKDRTTDVLAFALSGDDGRTVGDVYLGFDQAARQAEEVGVELAQELARLAIHGTLHVLGYDHQEGPERLESPMFQLQERLLQEVLEGS